VVRKYEFNVGCIREMIHTLSLFKSLEGWEDKSFGGRERNEKI